jgi:TPR repeat protein
MLRLAWRLEQHPASRPAALAWYLRAADNGSIEAQYHLAQSYLNGGLGVVDAERAQYWYGRVREQGVCPSVIRAPHTL